MFKGQDKSFLVAFTISLFVHTTILINMPNLNSDTPEQLNKTELTYVKEELTSRKFEPKSKAKDKLPPSYIKRDKIYKKIKELISKNIFVRKPQRLPAQFVSIKKTVKLADILDKNQKNPNYMSYYRIIRKKIKETAYRNYNRIDNGEVYVSFVVSIFGQLWDIRINEEETTASTYLKDIALKSVKDAEPFPDFPPDLADFAQLSFNIIICFESE